MTIRSASVEPEKLKETRRLLHISQQTLSFGGFVPRRKIRSAEQGNNQSLSNTEKERIILFLGIKKQQLIRKLQEL